MTDSYLEAIADAEGVLDSEAAENQTREQLLDALSDEVSVDELAPKLNNIAEALRQRQYGEERRAAGQSQTQSQGQ